MSNFSFNKLTKEKIFWQTVSFLALDFVDQEVILSKIDKNLKNAEELISNKRVIFIRDEYFF